MWWVACNILGEELHITPSIMVLEWWHRSDIRWWERHSKSISGSLQLMCVQQKIQRCPCVYGGNRKILGLGEEAQGARIYKPVANGKDQRLPWKVPAHQAQSTKWDPSHSASQVQGTPSPTTPWWRLGRILKSQDQSKDSIPLRFWEHRR